MKEIKVPGKVRQLIKAWREEGQREEGAGIAWENLIRSQPNKALHHHATAAADRAMLYFKVAAQLEAALKRPAPRARKPTRQR